MDLEQMKANVFNIYLLLILFNLMSNQVLFAQPAEIKGKVIDASTKKPICNAEIKIYMTNCSPWYSAISDSLGNYIFPSIRPFKYDLICYKDKYISQSITNIRTPDDSHILVDFNLRKIKHKKDVHKIDTLIYTEKVKRMEDHSLIMENPTIRSLKKDISINWHIRKDGVCYITNDDFINSLFVNYQYILKKYKSKDINKLFGKPTQLIVNNNQLTFTYVIDPPCPADICKTVYFKFDSLNYFKYIDGVIRHEPIH
jgi:hypothetical protein